MTIIAIRNGIMAADSMVAVSGVKRTTQKIFQRNGMIIGFTGYVEDAHKLMGWFVGDKSGPPDYILFKDDEVDAMLLVLYENEAIDLVRRTGFVERLRESKHSSSDAYNPNFFTAIGSGAPAAMGAMIMGAGAVEAVKAACEVNEHCCGPVQSASFRGDDHEQPRKYAQ